MEPKFNTHYIVFDPFWISLTYVQSGGGEGGEITDEALRDLC